MSDPSLAWMFRFGSHLYCFLLLEKTSFLVHTIPKYAMFGMGTTIPNQMNLMAKAVVSMEFIQCLKMVILIFILRSVYFSAVSLHG